MSAYVGRFAPSPTGPLHFGSLVAALGSFLDARAAGGRWLLRIEDLDRTRERPAAADAQLRALEAFGLEWDGAPLRQSGRDDAYVAALEQLHVTGLIYPCGCTRKQIAEGARVGSEGPVYAGTCRAGLAPGRRARALRLRVPAGEIGFRDRLQGPQVQDLARDIGDFVLQRADGFFAYQLAVVVDDAEQQVTAVVRGADLLLSTPRQIHLQRLLGLEQPDYLHLPLAVDAAGDKLSKTYAAAPIDPADPIPALLRALRFLGQPLPPERPENVAALLRWARDHWSVATIPHTRAITPDQLAPIRR